MRPIHLLRFEAVAVLAGALATYVWLDSPIWLFVVLILATDLSILAYLAGSRLGSLGYNVAHLNAWPLALAGLGVWFDVALGMRVAAVLAAHIEMDRGRWLPGEVRDRVQAHPSVLGSVPEIEARDVDPSSAS